VNLSLQARLLLVALLILLGFAGLTGLALDKAFRESAEAALQDRLQGHMFALLAATEVEEGGKLSFGRQLPDSRFRQPGSGLYASVRHAGEPDPGLQSRSLLGVSLVIPDKPQTGQGQFRTLQLANGTTLYSYTYGAKWEAEGAEYSLVYFVAENMDSYHEQISQYRNNLWGWLGLATVLLLLAQAGVLRWGLRPLRRVERDLAKIKAGDKDRLDEDYPRELHGLTQNLNLLLQTTQKQLARYRDALGNVSHSLKTPLTVLCGAVLHHSDQEELKQTASEQLDHMQQIIDYHLQRAATAGPVQLGKPIAIKPVAERILNTLKKSYADKSITVELVVDDDVKFYSDEGDLFELLGNMLDNAFKWCHERIVITAENDRQRGLNLYVDDDGPGIPPEVGKQVLERGKRIDPHVEGQGLGLAMVHETVLLYGGQLQIKTSSLGGAAISLHLP
jgi:two-component system sensor histidine kinase PhoQ